MLRFLLGVLLLLATTLSAQQPSDLSATLNGVPERILPGASFDWSATFTNHGPNAVTEARATAQFGPTPCLFEERLTLAVGESRTFACRTDVPLQTPPYSINGYASINYPFDYEYLNNNDYRTVRYITKPDLRVYFNTREVVTVPGLPFPLTVIYDNVAFATAEDARLTIDVPSAIAIRTQVAGCTVSGTRVTCELGDVPEAGEEERSNQVLIPLEIVAPEGTDVRFEVTAEISSPSGDAAPERNKVAMTVRNYRTFYVTSTNDEGAGSLREAINTANASCNGQNPCLIAFRIEGLGAGAVASIVPRTPLPVVRAENIIIDGQTQHLYTGRSAELPRPIVELRGSELREGDGLALTSPCSLQVRGLVINGFPRHGLYISTQSGCAGGYFGFRAIAANYIGTDPTGQTTIPNQRGIYMDGNTATPVYENVISGNTRAGIFIARGPNERIYRNVIGLNATGTAPLGNGASGVYVGPDADGADVFYNHIAFNADAGVSIGTGADWVNVHRNAIHANRQLAIDYGLDGPTPNAPLTAPVVLSARYDAANGGTTIDVMLPPDAISRGAIHVYANDAPDPGGYGEAQYYLGEAIFVPETGHHQLVHTATDLRGKWIAAQQVYTVITTFSNAPRSEAEGPYSNTRSSEMGRAVEVQW
ncbi:MAG TPA: right-handed parallel beta-helix repeat-containing protein [Thermoanaerobaculia bacterium]|jgi:hypothetical protein